MYPKNELYLVASFEKTIIILQTRNPPQKEKKIISFFGLDILSDG